MEYGSKIVELLSEMLHKFDMLTGTVVNLKRRVANLSDRVDNLTVTVDIGKVESEIIRLNVISTENSRALLKWVITMNGLSDWKRAVFKS
jgi:hypothetical protein